MSAPQIKTTPRNRVAIQSSIRHVDSGSETPYGQSEVKTEDTSAPFSKDVHFDSKPSLEAKAPPVQNPYSMKNSMTDLPCAAYALDLFLASHMMESEDYLHKGDPQK